jgi:acyl-CoA thioester hydrolase
MCLYSTVRKHSDGGGKVMPEASLTFRGCVMPWHCDQMGHMNARHIYACFDDATGVFADQLGAGFGKVASSGLGWADVHQEIEFMHELRNGSAITVATTLLALGRSSIQFRHDLRSHGSPEAAAQMTCKSVRFNTTTRRSLPIEEELRIHIAALLPPEVKT